MTDVRITISYDCGNQWDLYQRPCEDCEITPRPELFHPNPED